jgi:hypothetical protein
MNKTRKALEMAQKIAEKCAQLKRHDGTYVDDDCSITFAHAAITEALAEPAPGFITLPREMDEDLYYTVGSALGAQSPDQCGRADSLWKKLVARADSDAIEARIFGDVK